MPLEMTILGSYTHVAAPERVVGIARDNLRDAIDATDGGVSSVGRIYGRVHKASGPLRTPRGLRATCQRCFGPNSHKERDSHAWWSWYHP